MKSNTFNYRLLTLGIATLMGVSMESNAATSSADSAPSIDNIATATYNIGGVAQTPAKSNKVTVNITQSAAFSLTAQNDDGNEADDYNKAASVTPKGRVEFNHMLTNAGNVEDTYTLSLTQGGTIPGTTQDASNYDLDKTNVTYTIFNADDSIKSTTTVTGTVFQNTAIKLKPNERLGMVISAKTAGNIGGNSQNLTLSAVSDFFTNSDPSKATLTNINNSVTKVPVFKITSTPNTTLDLNNNGSIVTYTITVLNDGSANYSADAEGIKVFSNLPAGLRLADKPNTSVSNGASISTGKNGAGTGSANDSIAVTLLNLNVGETATIKFDVQRDANESADIAVVKDVVNHAHIELDLGADSGVIYDSTDSADTNQNTDTYYPASDDSELKDGTVNNATGGDAAAPLTANQRAFRIDTATSKEIPTNTSATTLVTHSAVIRNTGKEVEGDQPDDIKFTIIPKQGSKVTVVEGTVELIYDADGNPDTPNDVYTITRDGNGDNDLSTAKPKNGASAWTGMKPDSTVTITYQVESNDAVINTVEEIDITLVAGGQDAPSTGNRIVINKTAVKGLILNKQQAINKSCQATATLTFNSDPLGAEPNDCIVYKISAFNNFSTKDPRFAFDNVAISDAISQFANKATVLTDATTPSFAIKLDDVTNASKLPSTNKYSATLDANQVGGVVTKLSPQQYAAMIFAVKINPEGTMQP